MRMVGTDDCSMATVLRDLLDLLLPRDCVGCGQADSVLCPQCTAALDVEPVYCGHISWLGGEVTCWAVAAYRDIVRIALLAYKERRVHDLVVPFAIALAGVVVRIFGLRPSVGQVALVPIPSTRAAARSRGGDHVRRLAVHTAHRLGTMGLAARVHPLLEVARHRPDSVGQSADDRRASVAGTFQRAPSRAGPDPPDDAVVLVLDDLVTTGATMTEAVGVLASAGVVPAGALALAWTPLRAGT